MTPREFFAAAGGLKPRGAGPSRGDFEALMRAFPDFKEDDFHGE